MNLISVNLVDHFVRKMLKNNSISKKLCNIPNILQAVFLPLVMIAPIAAILVLILDLEPRTQLTKGILYACLFISCAVIARWKSCLAEVGLSRRKIRPNLFYSGIILVISYIFIFIAQPVEGFVNVRLAVLWPILFFLIVAMAEECWFRGLIFTALYEWKGACPAIIGSALLFGLMHLPTQGWIGLRHIFYGLPLGAVRLKTGNIWGLIITHWLVNLADTLILFSTHDFNSSYALVASVIYLFGFPGVALLILFIDKKYPKIRMNNKIEGNDRCIDTFQ